MQEKLTIAGIQGHLAWENPIQNRSYFEQKIKSLPADIDLIVLPEMFSTGFTMNPQCVTSIEQKKSLEWMLEMAILKDAALCGSLIILENELYYNRCYFVESNATISYYDKRHTFSLAGEDKIFQKGVGPAIVSYKGWKFMLQICYDLRFPVFSRNTWDYDALIYVANWPEKRIFAWDTLLKARAIENMAYCIGVNRVGLDGNGYEYAGHSGIYDCLGATLAFAKAKEDTIIAILSKEQLLSTRKKLNFLGDQDHFLLHL